MQSRAHFRECCVGDVERRNGEVMNKQSPPRPVKYKHKQNESPYLLDNIHTLFHYQKEND